MGAITYLGGMPEYVEKLSLDGAARCNICIAKKQKTPGLYPRNNGAILKKPLR